MYGSFVCVLSEANLIFLDFLPTTFMNYTFTNRKSQQAYLSIIDKKIRCKTYGVT